jgi:tRNA (guanine26-N2/guanine27-N2)-dimethyltransferase
MSADRDLNVAVVLAEAASVGRFRRGWEMLAATGVRGLRLVHEAAAIDRLELTEGHGTAFPALEANVAGFRAEGATARRHDARVPLERAAFDYVDLDPYGSPLPFLDAALDAAAPGALLAVTATDLRVLAGVDRAAAERLYGGRPVRGRLGPEGGLRLMLAAISTRAAARGRQIVPRLSYVGGHHLRAYVRLVPRAGPEPLVGTIDPARWTGPSLGEGGPFGPLWLGPLFDPTLVERLQVPASAVHPVELGRRLEMFRQESRLDRPFYYESNSLAEELGLSEPPSTDAMTAALAERGFRLARSHARAGAFRTDAPRPRVQEAARALAQSQKERVRA